MRSQKVEDLGDPILGFKHPDEPTHHFFGGRFLFSSFKPVNIGVIYLRKLRHLSERQTALFSKTTEHDSKGRWGHRASLTFAVASIKLLSGRTTILQHRPIGLVVSG